MQEDKSEFKFSDGKKVPIQWQLKESYKDEYTTEELPAEHIRAAVVDELK